MSDKIYMCPFRKNIRSKNSFNSYEYFMPCDLEGCDFCEPYDCGAHIVYRCDNPTAYGMGWIIKREPKVVE